MKLCRPIYRPSIVLTARLLLLLLFCATGGSYLAAQQDASSQPQTYTVRGSIINKFTNQPVARALVIIQGEAQNAMFTDSEGQFEFDNIPPGQCTISATRPGFMGSRQPPAPEVRSIQVGPNLTDLTLALLPTGTISGQVTLSTSDSAENIQVFLLHKSIEGGRATWEQIQVRRTNSDGVYAFSNLPPGEYRVYTAGSVDPAPGPRPNQLDWGFPSEYYPNSADTAIHLAPGQQVQANLMLTHEPFYPVTVSVANASRQGASLQVYDDAGDTLPYPPQYDTHNEVMILHLPKGRYVIDAQSSMRMFGSREITVQNGPLSNVGLTLLPTNPIQVTIRREFTAQSNDQRGTFTESFLSNSGSAGVNLMLHKVTGSSGQVYAGGNLRHAPGSSDNSSFALENVRPGAYWVYTYASQGYVASIYSGNTDLAKEPLVISASGSPPPIDVVLRNDVASLSVSLNHAASMSSGEDSPAYLSITPQFSTTWQAPGRMQIAQSGTTISNLPPGTYRVLAFDRPQELEYNNSQAMSTYAGKGQIVTLDPGSSAKISVDVISTDSQSQ